MIQIDWKGVALLLAAAGVTVYLVKRQIPKVPDALDPFSTSNLIYKWNNTVYGAVTGDPHFNLGAWIWELFNDDDWGPLGPPTGGGG